MPINRATCVDERVIHSESLFAYRVTTIGEKAPEIVPAKPCNKVKKNQCGTILPGKLSA